MLRACLKTKLFCVNAAQMCTRTLFTRQFLPVRVQLNFSLLPFRLIAANERVWLTEGNEFHLVDALAQLIESFTVTPQLVNAVDR